MCTYLQGASLEDAPATGAGAIAGTAPAMAESATAPGWTRDGGATAFVVAAGKGDDGAVIATDAVDPRQGRNRPAPLAASQSNRALMASTSAATRARSTSQPARIPMTRPARSESPRPTTSRLCRMEHNCSYATTASASSSDANAPRWPRPTAAFHHMTEKMHALSSSSFAVMLPESLSHTLRSPRNSTIERIMARCSPKLVNIGLN